MATTTGFEGAGVTCPGCGAPVSFWATDCAECGERVRRKRRASRAPVSGPRATGRRLGLHTVLSLLMAGAGMVFWIAGDRYPELRLIALGAGGVLLFGGLLWYLVARVLSWWDR